MRQCPLLGRGRASNVCVLIETQGGVSGLSLMSVGHENRRRCSYQDLPFLDIITEDLDEGFGRGVREGRSAARV